MKKIFWAIFLVCLLSLILVPILAEASIVPPPTGENGTYTICDFSTMLGNVYSFIVTDIATPLAIIALTIGGACMLVSAGNPKLFGLGKIILFSAIIGLILALGSTAIINFILTRMLGYTGTIGTQITGC